MTYFLTAGAAAYSLYAHLFFVVFLLFIMVYSLFCYGLKARYYRDRLKRMFQFTRGLHGLQERKHSPIEEVGILVDSLNDSRLQKQFLAYREAGQRLYEGAWYPGLQDYFGLEQSIPARQQKLGSPAFALHLFSLGFFASIVMAIFAYSELKIDFVLPSALMVALPLLWSSFFAVLLYVQHLSYHERFQQLFLKLKQAMAEVLPIYDERTGTAALIQEFRRYDRQMSESADRLTQGIQTLSGQTLVDTVASSIEQTLERHVAPSLAQSNEALKQLCTELENRQREDMRLLSQQFSQSMAQTLSQGLAPIETQVAQYNAQLNESKNAMNLAFVAMETHRAQSNALDQTLLTHFEELNQRNSQWNQKMEQLANIQDRLTQSSEQLAAMQTGSEQYLAGKMELLSTSILNYCKEGEALLAKLKEENQILAQDLRQSQQESARILQDYRHLTQQITTSALDIERHRESISQELKQLHDGLNGSVEHFTRQIQKGVQLTLGDFDSGLAELAERLSYSATAIRDSLQKLTDSVQSDKL